MSTIVFWSTQAFLIPVFSPFFIGVVRKIKARMQNRVGTGVFQPYRDLWKLFHKDEAVSADASWIFSFAPYIIFSVTLIVGASVPLFGIPAAANPLSDLLVIVYLLAIGVFFLALAGLDTGSAFGGFGSSREVTIAALTEGSMIFSLVAVAFVAHTTNLFHMASVLASLPLASAAPIVLSFAAFVVALLAENGRFPFDNPATHLELTMIHEAMILEYSGKKLALVEWASANKFLIFIALGTNLYFPWGLAMSLDLGSMAWGILIFFAKALIASLFVAVLESIMAKFRFFRLPDLLFSSFVLSLIAISLII